MFYSCDLLASLENPVLISSMLPKLYLYEIPGTIGFETRPNGKKATFDDHKVHSRSPIMACMVTAVDGSQACSDSH